MTVTRIGPRKSGLRMEPKGSRNFHDEILFVSDDPNQTKIGVYGSRDCPKIGDPSPEDPLCFVKSVDINRTPGNKYEWIARVEYSAEREKDEDEKNPLNIPAKISIRGSFETKEATVDIHGNQIQNKAGEPIRGLMVNENMLVYVVRKSVEYVPDWVEFVMGGVNDAPVTLRGHARPTGTVLVTGLDIGEELVYEKTVYSEVTLELTYRRAGWTERPLNQGFCELVEQNTALVPAVQPNGMVNLIPKKQMVQQRILVGDPPAPPAEPVFLNHKGQRFRRADGTLKEPLDPGDAISLAFDLKHPFDFSLLPLK